MRAQNQAAMPLNHRLFSSAIVQLCASSVLLQLLQLPGLQLRQGQPALAQGQLHTVQEEATEQIMSMTIYNVPIGSNISLTTLRDNKF